MNAPALGRLSRVELREIWSSEAADFTPWLGRPDNLAVLAETLGLDLELEAQEKAVGPFRADLLCKKDIGSGGAWVLIENQLERTDHLHLGQLLTYASGLEAVTIVWIAATFTEEHRATLDWLNKITDESFSFFGLEVELWKIENSIVAPKFNVVSKPNDWSRSVGQGARSLDDPEVSETRAMQREYWTALNDVLTKVGGQVSGNRKAQPQSWMSYPIGRSSFNLGAVMVRPKNRIRAYVVGKGFERPRSPREAVQAVRSAPGRTSPPLGDLPARPLPLIPAFTANPGLYQHPDRRRRDRGNRFTPTNGINQLADLSFLSQLWQSRNNPP